MQKLNEEVYRYIFPSVDVLMYEPDLKYATNNIFQRQLLLVGSQRSGKTASVRMIALKAVSIYGEENVNAVSSKDFGVLIEYGIQNTLVNILFFDDATLQKVPQDALRDYFRIRHVVKQVTGRSNGLVVTVIGTHSFFACPKNLRVNCPVILWKSPPTNPFDRRTALGFIGDKGMTLLEAIELQKDEDPELIGISVAYFLNTVGMFITPEPTVNVVREIK